MSYEDVDEVKTKLHNAYMQACTEFGNSSDTNERKVVAMQSGHIVIGVFVEKF